LAASGKYYFCWKPPYVSYEGYIVASDSFWVVTEKPTVVRNEKTVVLNQGMESIALEGSIGYYDQFQMFYGTPDCFSGNEIGNLTKLNGFDIYSIWYPETT
jgi:hypothetical protein